MSIRFFLLLAFVATCAVFFLFPQLGVAKIIGGAVIIFGAFSFIENEVRGMKHFPKDPPEYYYGRKVATIIMGIGTLVFMLPDIISGDAFRRIVSK